MNWTARSKSLKNIDVERFPKTTLIWLNSGRYVSSLICLCIDYICTDESKGISPTIFHCDGLFANSSIGRSLRKNFFICWRNRHEKMKSIESSPHGGAANTEIHL